jgi:hydrogenase expression/formation protein HypC
MSGVFRNALLTHEAGGVLQRAGFRVYCHRLVPTNDGGLSRGQFTVAACSLTLLLYLASGGSNSEERLMCLGIPGKVVETYREHDVLMGKVDFTGVCKRVCLEHVPQVRVGDYVLVHVGFALSTIDEAEARRVFELLAEMKQLEELQVPSP